MPACPGPAAAEEGMASPVSKHYNHLQRKVQKVLGQNKLPFIDFPAFPGHVRFQNFGIKVEKQQSGRSGKSGNATGLRGGEMAFYTSTLGKGTLQNQKIGVPGKIHNFFAKTGVTGVYKTLSLWGVHPVSEALTGMFQRLGMELKTVVGPPVRFQDTEFLDGHDLGGDMDPLSVSFLKLHEKGGQTIGPHQHERLSFSENRRIAGGKKEMNQVGRVIRMKMGQKDLPNPVMTQSDARKLSECAGSQIKEDGFGASQERHGRGRPVAQGDTGPRS